MTARHAPLIGLGLAALLAGCAGAHEYGPNSPYYTYPVGMTIELLQPLAIPPGEASVRLQYGRTVARNGVQEVDPYCVFEIDTVSASAQTVPPARFRVIRVQRRMETFSGMPALPWRAFAVGLGRDDGPSHLYYVTEFRLQANGHPVVRSLACQHNVADVAIPRHLTMAEMRQALGNYFSLDLAR